MIHRKLGNTGYDVGLVGFGTWQLGGKRWQDMSTAKSVRLLQQSLDFGVNLYDAAVVYGQYRNEMSHLQSQSLERLGQAFSDRRDRVIYCVKLGQFDEYTHRHDYNAARVIDQFQYALRALKTDFVDIVLIHAPSLQMIHDGRAITILQTLQAMGLIRAIGYSFEAEPEHVAAALKQPIDVIMLQCNLIDQECVNAIEQLRVQGIGVLVGGPFKRGYLTGLYTNTAALPIEDDYWQWNLKRCPQKVEKVLTRVRHYLTEYGSPRQLRYKGLEFLFKQAGVASIIVGHRAIEEVMENIESIEQIANIYQEPFTRASDWVTSSNSALKIEKEHQALEKTIN